MTHQTASGSAPEPVEAERHERLGPAAGDDVLGEPVAGDDVLGEPVAGDR
ncbi:hypothetical protein [Streptomyces sp. NPDC088801]